MGRQTPLNMFILVTLLATSALASPARNQCPTLQQIGEAFQEEFKVEIPEGILDCVHGGDNCPFSSFEDFFDWFEASTGLEIPDVDIDVDELMDACMSGSRTVLPWRRLSGSS